MNPSSSKALELIQKLNSSVLLRSDKDFIQIEATARLVHLYKWNNSESKWEDAKVFGPFFLYSRHNSPLYRMTILNREEPNDWVEAIDNTTHILDSTEAENMCIFMNSSKEVNGLWFPEPSENIAISKVLRKTIDFLQRHTRQIDVEMLFESANKFSPTLNSSSHQNQQFPTLTSSPHSVAVEDQARMKIEELFLPTSALGLHLRQLEHNPHQSAQLSLTKEAKSVVEGEAAMVRAVCLSMAPTHNPEMAIFGDPPKSTKDSSKLPHQIVSRQNISDALILLVQEDWFIDKVYEEYLRCTDQ